MDDRNVLSRVILVIESDHGTRVKIRHILEDANCFVISVANGADALTTLQKMSVPSLILIGTRLPLMSAEQFLTVLRNEETYAKIPIAQLKGPSDPDLPGICHFIPIDPDKDELMKAIEACLKGES